VQETYINCEGIFLSKNTSQHGEGNDGKRRVDEHGKGTKVMRARLHYDVFTNDIGNDDAKREGK